MRPTKISRADAESAAEGAGEMAGVVEAPFESDFRDIALGAVGVGERVVAMIQPPPPDIPGDAFTLGFEEAVQIAARDLVSSGDEVRVELRILEVRLDER